MIIIFFFFNDTATTEIYTLSLHDALPISNVVILTLVLLLSLVPAGRVGAAYEQIVVKDGGVLTGLVKLAGAPPRLEPIHVNKNREVCGEAKESEALVAGADRGVRGSVLPIQGGGRGQKPSGEDVGGKHQCPFVTHRAATMSGYGPTA